jgi:hypothetical protein
MWLLQVGRRQVCNNIAIWWIAQARDKQTITNCKLYSIMRDALHSTGSHRIFFSITLYATL